MRIQHNIMAMNAYRNYNNNSSALSKNLEKLSSGYKINRAGDDAAGLAISEKMRAQITGLPTIRRHPDDCRRNDELRKNQTSFGSVPPGGHAARANQVPQGVLQRLVNRHIRTAVE